MFLIEPTISSKQHVAFLSALILSVRNAYPSEPVVFLSNSNKIKEIERYISLKSDCSGIVFRDMYYSKTPQSTSWLNRQLSLIFSVITCCYSKNYTHSGVIFCSTHWPMLLYMSWTKQMPWFRKKSMVVVHDAFSLLSNDRLLFPLIKLRKYSNHAVMLSKGIASSVTELLDYQIKLKSIHLPCIWEEASGYSKFDRPLRFGFIGESKKGLKIFNDIARDVIAVRNDVEFWSIGSSSKDEVDAYSGIIKGMSCEWISDEEYSMRIKNMSFLIFPYSDKRYNYRASGTFVDSLSFVKPSISIANRYVVECAKELGDYCIICNDTGSIVKVLVDIIDNMSEDRYLRYQKNILDTRDIFNVNSVGNQIKDVFGQ